MKRVIAIVFLALFGTGIFAVGTASKSADSGIYQPKHVIHTTNVIRVADFGTPTTPSDGQNHRAAG